MDIDNVSNTCLSCYSVNTLKARTMIHQALPPIIPCVLPSLELCWTERGLRWGQLEEPNPYLVC